MGSVYISHVFPPVSKSELQSLIAAARSEADEYHGHQEGYSGALNSCDEIRILDKTFCTHSEAQAYVEENTSKREAFVVRVGDFTKTFENASKTNAELTKRLKDAEAALENWGVDIIQRVKAGKSKTKGCSKCGSSIAVKYISTSTQAFGLSARSIRHYGTFAEHPGLYCPVCGHQFLVTDTDQKRKDSLSKKVSEIRARHTEAKKAYEAKLKDKPFWYLGGWAAS